MKQIRNLMGFANKLYDKLCNEYNGHDDFAPAEYGGYRDSVLISIPYGKGYIWVTVTTLEVLMHIRRVGEPTIFDGVEYSSCKTQNEVIERVISKIKEYVDSRKLTVK